MSKPCFPCRSRKVRCDGARPMCGPCSRARKTVQCVYLDAEVSTGSAVKQDLLRKGAACASCRSKKKKCDGKLPFCNTCKVAGKEDECQYNDGTHRSVKAELMGRIEELEERLRMYENHNASGSAGPSGSSIQPSSDANALVPAGIPESASASTSMLDPASIFGDDLLPPTSPTSLSSGLQLPQDYDYSAIRTRFFSHCPQIGIALTDERRDALYAGDVSIIHPALLYAAQLWGCTVTDDQTSPFNVIAESIQLQNALATLDDISLTLDPTTALEANQIVSMYFFTRSNIFKGREYLLKASHIALHHNIRIVSVAQSITRDDNTTCRQVTVQADEQLSIICQLIGMDRSQGLMFGTPMIFPDDYDLELKVLPTFYSSLSLDCFCVVSRALSVLYLREAKQVISDWEKDGCCVDRSTRWYIRFTDLIARIREHNIEVDRRRELTAMLKDIHNDRALKISQMTALSALADLHFAMAPSILESRKLAVEVVTRIVHMTSTFVEEDYIRLDPILTFTWTSCMNVIRLEVSSTPILIPEIVVAQMLNVLRDTTAMVQKKIPYVNGTVKPSLFEATHSYSL